MNIKLLAQLAEQANFKRKRKVETKIACLQLILEDNDSDQFADLALVESVTLELDPVNFGSAKLRDATKIDGDCFIITSAQNNSQLHETAFRLLELFASEKDANLIVMPVFYNKGAFSRAVEQKDNFPCLVAQDDFILNNFAAVYTNSHVLPTAKMPVNAAADLNEGERFSIIAAPKNQRKELPRNAGQRARTAHTTGSITLPNYLSSRAGSVAERDHKIGAILYENGTITNLEYDDNLGWDYEFNTIVLGDVHAEMLDANCWRHAVATIKEHNIKNIVLHDLLDMRNRGGHSRHDPIHLYREQNRTISDDVQIVEALLCELSEIDCVESVNIVYSNHDDMLSRWLSDLSYQVYTDPQNSRLYYTLKLAQLDQIDAGHDLEPAIKTALPAIPKIRFLQLDESLLLNSVEVGHHGHLGVSGSRGGASLLKTGYKMVIGHSHSAAITGDLYTVGTISKLQHGYNKSATTWTQSSALICSTGRVQLIDHT